MWRVPSRSGGSRGARARATWAAAVAPGGQCHHAGGAQPLFHARDRFRVNRPTRWWCGCRRPGRGRTGASAGSAAAAVPSAAKLTPPTPSGAQRHPGVAATVQLVPTKTRRCSGRDQRAAAAKTHAAAEPHSVRGLDCFDRVVEAHVQVSRLRHSWTRPWSRQSEERRRRTEAAAAVAQTTANGRSGAAGSAPRACARAPGRRRSRGSPRVQLWGPSAARLARPAHPTLWVTTDKQARAVAEAWPTKAPCVAAQQSRRIGTPYDGVVHCTLYVCYVFVYTVYL